MKGSRSAATVVVLLLAAIASSAYADDKAGWGMNAGIGVSLIKDRDGDETFEGNSFGYTWGLEYRFPQRWALGIDLFSLGRGRDTLSSGETTITVGGFDLRGRIIFPVSETVELYGRLGYAGYFADVDPGRQNLGEEATSFGFGLDVDRGEHFTFRIEGRYFDGRRDESGGLLTVGLNYRF